MILSSWPSSSSSNAAASAGSETRAQRSLGIGPWNVSHGPGRAALGRRSLAQSGGLVRRGWPSVQLGRIPGPTGRAVIAQGAQPWGDDHPPYTKAPTGRAPSRVAFDAQAEPHPTRCRVARRTSASRRPIVMRWRLRPLPQDAPFPLTGQRRPHGKRAVAPRQCRSFDASRFVSIRLPLAHDCLHDVIAREATARRQLSAPRWGFFGWLVVDAPGLNALGYDSAARWA